MELTIIKKIGKTEYPFTVSGDNLHEVLMNAEKLSFGNVPRCGKCDSDFLFLSAYVTKEKKFKYVKISCGKCRASVTFGQKMEEPDIYYLRKNDNGDLDWQEYDGDKPTKSGDTPVKSKSTFAKTCEEYFEKYGDKCTTALYDFGGGKYISAGAIPLDKRGSFIAELKKLDFESTIPF